MVVEQGDVVVTSEWMAIPTGFVWLVYVAGEGTLAAVDSFQLRTYIYNAERRDLPWCIY